MNGEWQMILGRFASGIKGFGGFTLIEILVAMGVFAIASLGLAIGVTSVIRSNQQSYLASIATNLAQDKLEELKSTPATLAECTINCETPVPTTDGVEFTRTWEVFPNDPTLGVTRIDVIVQWADHTSHSVTISSAIQQ